MYVTFTINATGSLNNKRVAFNPLTCGAPVEKSATTTSISQDGISYTVNAKFDAVVELLQKHHQQLTGRGPQM